MMPDALRCPLDAKQVHWLLHDLCVVLGYCLPAHERDRILAAPPGDVDSFTDAVMMAEGLNPQEEKKPRRGVRDMVARHFARGADAPLGRQDA
jgi:hypothetical protein